MRPRPLHRFQVDGRRYVIDTETCFCFECDAISWDVLAYYPEEPVNRILALLEDQHPRKELEEVVGELEWFRVTRAILAQPKDEELLAQAGAATALERMTVVVALSPTPLEQLVAAAGQALLAGSGACERLALALRFPGKYEQSLDGAAERLGALRQAARTVGKTLDILVEAPLSAPVRGHAARARATLRPDADLHRGMRLVLDACAGKAARVADRLQRDEQVAQAAVVAQPETDRFHGLIQALYELGFRDIVLDLPAAHAARPALSPAAMAESLREETAWYAGQLLQGRYFNVSPMAELFHAVHEGKPIRRADPAGAGELAVDGAGRLFPSPAFIGNEGMQLGDVLTGMRHEEALQPFIEFGVLHMPACLRCWANGLCGGGYAAIHQARGGNPRAPEPAWCDSRRDYLAHAVAAFNQLASAGVNFTHITAAMTARGGKLSWLAAAKALFNMRLRARPLAEKDAEWLVRWENWRDAAYFLCNESGVLVATQYDREMDALHPRGAEQELVLTRLKGAPCGLLKLRPSHLAGLAWAWLYLHDKNDYADGGVRRSLRALLEEMRNTRHMRRLLVPVTTGEPELAACLEAIGFKRAGTQRQALFLHGDYHDVMLYLHE